MSESLRKWIKLEFYMLFLFIAFGVGMITINHAFQSPKVETVSKIQVLSDGMTKEQILRAYGQSQKIKGDKFGFTGMICGVHQNTAQGWFTLLCM